MKKKTARILNIFLYSLAVVILLYVFIDYSFIQEIPNCQNSFNFTNSSFLLKVNISTIPSIKDNSECLCSEKDYKLNDIVVFSYVSENVKSTVMHRIINLNSTSVITQNKNNSYLVPKKAIICAIDTRHRINF